MRVIHAFVYSDVVLGLEKFRREHLVSWAVTGPLLLCAQDVHKCGLFMRIYVVTNHSSAVAQFESRLFMHNFFFSL